MTQLGGLRIRTHSQSVGPVRQDLFNYGPRHDPIQGFTTPRKRTKPDDIAILSPGKG